MTGPTSISIGYGLLSQPDVFAPLIADFPVFILSHPEVAAHYLPLLEKSCKKAGAARIDHCLIPAGEKHKTLATAGRIWTALSTCGHYRDSILINLGGGMLCDIGGFCASTYLRGMKVIHCPTTLLGQIDAAIGGKTGVNDRFGKNRIGSFYAPTAVIADVACLETLPEREFISGLAELIKYGVTLDATLFKWLEKHFKEIVTKEEEILIKAISFGANLKAQVVALDEKDEKDKGQRIILNFGHTVGHALESLGTYKKWLHGEAVALGMVVAGHLSVQHGLNPEILMRLKNVLKAVGLPVKMPKMAPLRILTKIKNDKKHLNQRLQWVLLKDAGKAFVSDNVTTAQIEKALEASKR